MTPNDEEFLKKLQSAFRTEAEEHLQSISSGLLELEKTQDPERCSEIVAAIFRDAHSLKGAARAVNAEDIETICQSIENVFAAWRGPGQKPSPKLFDPLHKAVSAVGRILPGGDVVAPGLDSKELGTLIDALAGIEAEGSDSSLGETAEKRVESDQAESHQTESTAPTGAAPQISLRHSKSTPRAVPIAMLSTALSPVSKGTTGAAARGRTAAAPDTLRISATKLDSVLLQAEEMLAVKLTTAQRAADLRQFTDALGLWDREWSKMASELRTELEPLNKGAGEQTGHHPRAPAARLTEFIEWSEDQIKSLQRQLAAHVKAADHDRRTTTGMVDALLSDAKKLLMLPCQTLLEPFPRMVRELSRDQGKEVELVVSGDEVEIDKRVLNEMRDPLMHLLRNAVDHGVELPILRTRVGKPPRATIRVAVSQVDGNKIEIVVADDGRGINPADVNEAAVRRGVISAEQARSLGEHEALWLIFQPEVSTSPMITEISGRGLGMSIVKEKVERLGGRIMLETRPGEGTTFRLVLPLTLATFRGLLVHSAGQEFIIPVANVDRVLSVMADEIRTVEMRETVRINDQVISLVRLDAVLGLAAPPTREPPKLINVVVLSAGEKRIAFRVDEILSEQEVLVKRLGMPLARVRNVAGATVLGSGKAVPILNADDLLASAVKGGAPADSGNQDADAATQTRRKSLLVAEDSITARMLIKSILESAGYLVKTAVDGVDALTLLKSERFDLLVSDVEMPRMNGFELTEKIRANSDLANLPVVLVTALAKREDRERGVDAGANAYIVKGSFDQGNLLDIIQRLL